LKLPAVLCIAIFLEQHLDLFD